MTATSLTSSGSTCEKRVAESIGRFGVGVFGRGIYFAKGKSSGVDKKADSEGLLSLQN